MTENIRLKPDGTMTLELRRYEDNHPVERCRFDCRPGETELSIGFAGAEWAVRTEISPFVSGVSGGGFDEVLDIDIRLELTGGSASQVGLAAVFRFDDWTRDANLVIPGAVYGGNRFRVRKAGYPPIFEHPEDLRADLPVTVTDIPRLNAEDGRSLLEQTTEDAATPAVGWHSPALLRGWWLLATQRTEAGASGFTVEENADRTRAELTVSAPAVRSAAEKGDRAPDWRPGDSLRLRLRSYAFPCGEPQGLFDRLSCIRKVKLDGVPEEEERDFPLTLPFSAAWDILERKFNRDNWEPNRGYYAVGIRDNRYQDWQPGWVGGGMSTLPLLMRGSAVSRERAERTLDFLFSRQAESGFFHGVDHAGVLYGDGFHRPDSPRWHLVRKSADVLYFAMKQLLLQEKFSGRQAPERWIAGIRAAADAFVALWRRNGQFGQFVDVHTGELLVGGSTSAAIASAGLALASVRFGDQAYFETAADAALLYAVRDVSRGVTTGGPGEILQCPDSESAFGMLESFVVLHETTGDRGWLDWAARMARQCMSWCVSYDCRWPEGSEFGRLGIRSTGAVIANAQNKHGAPGICTLSGDSLLKLYRATGDPSFLDLLQDIARHLPQYLSRQDRPIRSWDPGKPELPEGWMCERVNLSDWEGKDKVGEVFRGTCWCETSLMLACAEVPGLYVQPDTGLFRAFDQIEARQVERDAASGSLTLRLRNPTAYPAEVTVLAELGAIAARRPLGPLPLDGCGSIALRPGETAVYKWTSGENESEVKRHVPTA